jgi:hypothetical protein
MSQKTGDLAKRRFKTTPFDALISLYHTSGTRARTISAFLTFPLPDSYFRRFWLRKVEGKAGSDEDGIYFFKKCHQTLAFDDIFVYNEFDR